MKIKVILQSFVSYLIHTFRRYRCYKAYSSKFKTYLKQHHFENKKIPNEKLYVKKWKVLSKRVDVYSYRFFSHYCGPNPNIVPEDIGHSYIEEALNPIIHRPTYGDKNLFPEIIGKKYLPRTIVCRINGGNLLDSEYHMAINDLTEYLGSTNNLILKKTVSSSSGKGIVKFVKQGLIYKSTDEKFELTKDFLMLYDDNFCLQEAVSQHPFMNKLCATSVNTIRLCVYRSVKDEKPHVTASILRIGKDGSFVDNIHSGGMFVGVDVESGVLGKYVIDQYGNKKEKWNGIDYANNSFSIPFWNNIISLSEYIGTRIHHHRLVALDIALDFEGNPILIEYNINTFSYWLFMYTNQEVFGEYTDEVIDYCKNKK